MQNKQISHSYGGMVQDLSKSQPQQNFYFEGHNIRINAVDSSSTNAVTNEKGNSLIITIPKPVIDNSNPNLKKILYNNKELIYKTTEIDNLLASEDQIIIGHSNSRNHVILFTTDNKGFDCIWKMTYDTYDLTLLYLRNMGFSKNNPIQTINNFENKNVDKIYWVDSKSQMRFINIYHSISNKDIEELIDISIDVIDMVGKYNLNQPIISNVVSGGKHTSGMIQYAYNLYRLNSSQTKISPLTELIALGKNNQGGDLNEIVGSTPIVNIDNIDSNYTNIKVYSIKYTSYNEIPSINLIEDKSIPDNKSIQIFDDGSVISTLSLDEFIFLGSDIIIPKHINSKNNRLFLANYQEINFDINLDTRAYSFPINNTSTVIYKDLQLLNGNINGNSKNVYADYDVPENHDSVNLDYNNNRYQYNNSVQGGEGKYLKYELTQSNNYNKNNKYFKDDEIYRLGIEFFNSYGQVSLPKWIADFKSKEGNLRGFYNTLKVTLKPEFFIWLNNNNFSDYNKPVGYKILIAERKFEDQTIIASGLLSPMMVNYKTSDDIQYPRDRNKIKTEADKLVKLPNFLVRNYNKNTIFGKSKPLKTALHLEEMCSGNGNDTEAFRAGGKGNKYSDNFAGRLYQFTSMFQMYSPEILFNKSQIFYENLNFKVKGSIKNTSNNTWGRVLFENKLEREDRRNNCLSIYYPEPVSSTHEVIYNDTSNGNKNDYWYRGFLHGDFHYDANRNGKVLFDRIYGGNDVVNISNFYQKATSNINYSIYGKPEFTIKGENDKNYNNDSKYRYTNSLKSILIDGKDGLQSNNDAPYKKSIVSVNSYGNNCVTFVLGDINQNHDDRKSFEDVALESNVNGDDNGIIGEIIKSNEQIYLGGIYGGNTYQDKKRTNYIKIGNYKKLNINDVSSTIDIDSPGDTFVNIFKFVRIVRTDESISTAGTTEITETVSTICETTVDLKNRSDISFNDWKSKFQPLDDEYHKYNKVYSQTSNLIQNRDINYNIKKVNSFDTNIIASKLKSSGELIDSWTDILQNEVLTLDGKHGAINSLVNFNDQIYGIQDRALAFLSINPRVQIQGDDGIGVELGTGGVLQEYKYASTESGTINKWSVIPTSRGIYYYDLLNKAFMVFNGQISNVSDEKNMHSYFISNTELEGLKIDNPLIKQGISSGYDQINDDVFMTFHRTNNKTPFTISFNERRNQFISFYDYIPSMYIGNGQNFITTNPDLKSIYRQYTGEYNKFYGINYPSYIILNVNPEANLDTVFDNIMYKSEVYLNDIDQPDKTLTKVRLYNEYQDSGLIPLTLGRNSNLRRKFRDWNAILPRNQGSRERIRNPWVKLLLQFDNNSNYKLILHDVIISYSV